MPVIRVVDIETTGIEPQDHRVVEIAAYDLDTDRNMINRVNAMLVLPGRDIPAEASAVHHLIETDMLGAMSFDQVWPIFTSGAPKYFAAHNCEFESSFLTLPEGALWICTFKSALRAWPDAPGHGNQVLRYHHKFDGYAGFDRKLASLAHRAEPDAYVTAHLLHKLLAAHPIDTLIQWTKEPKMFPTISFGKHKGTKWTDIPADYLQWMCCQASMDVDVKLCAKTELDRRAKQT